MDHSHNTQISIIVTFSVKKHTLREAGQLVQSHTAGKAAELQFEPRSFTL